MRRERVLTVAWGERRGRLLIVCAVAVVCCSVQGLAQSGRRRSPRVVAAPTVAAEEKTEAKTEAKPEAKPEAKTEAKAGEKTEAKAEETAIEPRVIERPVTVSAVLVGGNIVTDADYFKSNYVDRATRECRDRLMEQPVLEVTRGGKLTRKEAVVLAKKAKDSYVLWFEINMKTSSMWGDMVVSHIEYVVFKPQTAEILTQGKVNPNTPGIRRDGDVVRVPSVKRRATSEMEQVLEGARIIADRVRLKFVQDLRRI